MWGWLPGRVLSGSLMGLGRLGVCSCGRAGQLTVSREACLSRVVGLPGDWCRKHACHASASCLCGEWGVVGALACVGVACCRGSGAVRPGCLARFFCFSVCWRSGGGCGWVGCELYSGREHLTVRFLRQSVSCFVRVSLLFVFLSVRWMPWHQGPMKDVVACDIPRGAGWRAVIRGFPNGGTRHELCRVTCI